MTDNREIATTEAKEKAIQQANFWKRKQKPLVTMPELTGNPEIDSFADLEAVKAAFKARLMADSSKVRPIDNKHYFVLCFQTRAAKTAFLNQSNMRKYGDKYLNGCKIATDKGIELSK
ncbi:hypothetical protein [Kingella negevensis]|uniref:hypothetical protein n=1 Tax=Kingella negevensis TaxID=1522312 RepID=UPI00254AFE3F|nr:hypothetical protein [Kingella negevensis]MDK4689683.1 hypothetical protein [Kingella negevensis]